MSDIPDEPVRKTTFLPVWICVWIFQSPLHLSVLLISYNRLTAKFRMHQPLCLTFIYGTISHTTWDFREALLMQQVQNPQSSTLWVNFGPNGLSWGESVVISAGKNTMGRNVMWTGSTVTEERTEKLKRLEEAASKSATTEWTRQSMRAASEKKPCASCSPARSPWGCTQPGRKSKLDRGARRSEGYWGLHNTVWLRTHWPSTLPISRWPQNPLKCCITSNLQDVHFKLSHYPRPH